jgi:hypothetical protein
MGNKAILPFDPKSFLSQPGFGRSTSKYLKGQVVFAQGDPVNAVFYICKGKIAVTVGDTSPAVTRTEPQRSSTPISRCCLSAGRMKLFTPSVRHFTLDAL